MMDLQTPRDIKSLHERERRVIFHTILKKFRNDFCILVRNLTLLIISFLIRLSLQPESEFNEFKSRLKSPQNRV